VAPLFAVKAAVCAGIVLVLARAFFGRAPERVRPVLMLTAGFLGVVTYPIAVMLAAARSAAAFFVLAGMVCALSLAAWAARGPHDEDAYDDQDGEGDPRPRIDWKAFDRERARWERVRRV
jgi:hypothetical protein